MRHFATAFDSSDFSINILTIQEILQLDTVLLRIKMSENHRGASVPINRSVTSSKPLIMVILATAIGVSGCATQGNDPSLSPAENQLRATNSRFSQTVGEGAATGAVIGALAGALLSGHNRVAGAAIGAAAGGVLGGGAGYAVAQNNAGRSQTEADYNTAISEAQKDAANYQQLARAGQMVADQDAAAIDQLDAQYKANQITAGQYREEVKSYRQDNEILRKKAAAASEQSSSLRSLTGGDIGQRGEMLDIATHDDSAGASLTNQAAALSQALARVPQGA